MGGSVDVAGEVRGDVAALGGAVTINGTVLGDVVAIGGSITLGPAAEVAGDVTAVGGSVTRARGSVVRGEISTIGWTEGLTWVWPHAPWLVWRWISLPFTFLYVAGLFALALLVSAILPDHVRAVANAMEKQPERSVLIGLAALVLLIPFTLVLVLTIIGVPLLWMLFLAAKALGYVATVTLAGRKGTNRPWLPPKAA